MIKRIRLGVNNALTAEAKENVEEVLRSGRFSPGPKVKEFEEKFAELHGAAHGIFMNSGTDALRLSLLALKEKYNWADGDYVAVPALTFVATVNVILQANLKPFFVDVGMRDYLINPWNLKRRLERPNPRLRAVMPVHLFGKRCGRDVYEIAADLNLKVLEDSCESILNPIRGDVSCHSTYMAHHVTTGVGGFALTNDDELNWLIRSFANHGRDQAYLPGYNEIPLSRELLQRRFKFNRVGYSCRGTEFEAALGIAQIDGLKAVVAKRREVARQLTAALSEFENAFQLPEEENHAFMMYPIVIRETVEGLDKYDICLSLERSGIETRDMMPITTQPCYKTLMKEESFCVAEHVNWNGFYIPCHQEMTERDVEQIRNAFRGALLTKQAA